MQNKHNEKAFTIVELIIVIAVIGVLAAILVPTFANIIDKSNIKSALSDAKNALTAYIAEASDTMGFTVEIPEYTLVTVQKGDANDGYRWYRFVYTADKGLMEDPNLPEQPVESEEAAVPPFGFASSEDEEVAPIPSVDTKSGKAAVGSDVKYQPAISKVQIHGLEMHVRIYLPFGYFTVTDATVFFNEVSSGEYHTAAIDKNGGLWTWGQNTYGQLGDGSTTDRRDVKQIMPGTTFSKVEVGSEFTLALDTNGHLWAFGDNYYGQLGDGTTQQRNTPVQIMADTVFTTISAGVDHALAIDEIGNLWAWGENTCGQVGDGTSTQKSAPVKIMNGTTFVDAAAGCGYSLAVAGNGDLYAWGNNLHYQLGYEDSDANQMTPRNVSAPSTTYEKVAAGSYHSLALDNAGNIWAAGNNVNHQLGISNSSVKVFTRVPVEGRTFTEIACGENYSAAIGDDQKLYTFGLNNFGQLGISSNISLHSEAATPTVVPTLSEVAKISAGACYMTAINADGSLYAWGDNTYGQLGSPLIWDTNWTTPTSISQWFAYAQ